MTPCTLILSRSPEPAAAGRVAFEDAVAAGFAARTGCPVLVVPHLYYSRPETPAVVRIKAVSGLLLVAGWLPARALRWALHALGVRANVQLAADLRCMNLAKFDTPQAAVDHLLTLAGAEPGAVPAAVPGRIEELTATQDKRWYPVIDYERCIRCSQCLNFCLFHVYTPEEDGAVRVENPDNCKDECPACARVCPRGAIIFPEHPEGPINGDPGSGKTVEVIGAGQELKALLEQDAHRALRQRSGAKPE